jgi:hypothetical protein
MVAYFVTGGTHSTSLSRADCELAIGTAQGALGRRRMPSMDVAGPSRSRSRRRFARPTNKETVGGTPLQSPTPKKFQLYRKQRKKKMRRKKRKRVGGKLSPPTLKS